jgi:intracellular sulfur oxidation DsrE/DsrF family protein
MPPPMTAMSYSCMAGHFYMALHCCFQSTEAFHERLSSARGRSIQAHRPIRMPRSIRGFFFALIMALGTAHPVLAQGTRVQTPYAQSQGHRRRVPRPSRQDGRGAVLGALAGQSAHRTEAPYSLFPEDMSIIVLLHGTELVTVARKNEAKYEELVQRMRYYASQGVKFKVCGLALQDYGYTDADMQPFIEITPSAMTELVPLAEPRLCADHATGAGQTARDRGHPLRGRARACRVRPQSPPIRSRALWPRYGIVAVGHRTERFPAVLPNVAGLGLQDRHKMRVI